MKINWKSTQDKQALAPLALLNLEYSLELQVTMVLIREAEHLMDYKSLIVLDVSTKDGSITVNDETPEPLLSILDRNWPNLKERINRTVSTQEKIKKPSFIAID